MVSVLFKTFTLNVIVFNLINITNIFNLLINPIYLSVQNVHYKLNVNFLSWITFSLKYTSNNVNLVFHFRNGSDAMFIFWSWTDGVYSALLDRDHFDKSRFHTNIIIQQCYMTNAKAWNLILDFEIHFDFWCKI